jgi:hypothetical protein
LIGNGNVAENPVPECPDKSVGHEFFAFAIIFRRFENLPYQGIVLHFVFKGLGITGPLEQILLRGEMVADILHHAAHGFFENGIQRTASGKAGPVQFVGYIDKFFVLGVNHFYSRSVFVFPDDYTKTFVLRHIVNNIGLYNHGLPLMATLGT